MTEKLFEQQKIEKEKEKFIDYVKKRLEKQPLLDIEKIIHCVYCGKRIPNESTDFFIIPGGMPFDSIDCAFKGAKERRHPITCTCQFCGSEKEFQEIYQKILPKYEEVHGMTASGYAYKKAKEILQRKKIEEYEEKLKEEGLKK